MCTEMNLLYALLFACLDVGASADLSIQGTSRRQLGKSGTNDGAISGGMRVAEPAPWHVGVYKKTFKPYMQICGGTLVTERAIISAAHCFSRERNIVLASHYAVAAGKIYRPYNDPNDVHAQKSDVKEIKIPPRYQGNLANFQDDIAVLRVFKEFNLSDPYVQPACVNFNPNFDAMQLQDSLKGTVVGWGLTGANSSPSQVLLSASLPNVAIERCIEQSPSTFRSSITSDKICAGYTNGTAMCRGDSGGGLLFSANGESRTLFYLRGVVSTSPTTENSCNIYTWATFTHLAKHENFLKSHVPGIEEFCADINLMGLRRGQDDYRISKQYNCECPLSYDVVFYNEITNAQLKYTLQVHQPKDIK